jgi:hypothetical protein
MIEFLITHQKLKIVMSRNNILILDLYRLKKIDDKVLTLKLYPTAKENDWLNELICVYQRRNNYFPKAIQRLNKSLKNTDI